jgi:hypothetical protein
VTSSAETSRATTRRAISVAERSVRVLIPR